MLTSEGLIKARSVLTSGSRRLKRADSLPSFFTNPRCAMLYAGFSEPGSATGRRFGTAQDRVFLRYDRGGRSARRRPPVSFCGSGHFKRVGARRDRDLPHVPGAHRLSFLRSPRRAPGAPDTPGSRRTLQVTSLARRGARRYGGRGYVRGDGLSDDRPPGDAPRRRSARLRHGSGAADSLLSGRAGPAQRRPAAGDGGGGRVRPPAARAARPGPLHDQLRAARRAGGRTARPLRCPRGRRETPQGMRIGHRQEVVAALLLDALFGEPPVKLHPTVWMGAAISAFEKEALKPKNPHARRLAGILLALSIAALVYLSTPRVLDVVPRIPRRVFSALLISTALSMRGLAEAASAVERELREGNLERARASAAEMVGRDTADLPASEVARAAVESVAENTSDGVVAPMLYGLVFGAPGALAYRAVNTLDSMVGYRRDPYEELGWASARLDDLANFAPARITALMAAAVSGRPLRTLETARRYGPLTASPNAGWAEAAFAGALGLRLGGSNTYGGVVREGPILGDGRRPGPDDIRRSVRLMRRCCTLLAAAAVLVGGIGRG